MANAVESADHQAQTHAGMLSVVGLNYTVTSEKHVKSILQNVSCSLERGEMLCITGPSGSGKTSMLDIMSGRLVGSGTECVVQGKVFVQGAELTTNEFLRITGIVTQEDVFNPWLTAKETLTFAARLRLARAEQEARVDDVINRLQLESCAGTRVGDASRPDMRGLSGGEKRRLSIAVEILSSHRSVLLLDEPTSGLDAAAALNVTNILRDLANSGMTIVTTLHQPRASILSQFGQLLVLACGRRVYYGPTDEYLPYLADYLKCKIFESVGLQLDSDVTKSEILLGSMTDMLLDYLNPAVRAASQASGVTHLQIGALFCGASSESTDVVQNLADLYDASTLCKQMDARAGYAKGDLRAPALKQEPHIGWISRFWTILMRIFLTKYRDPMVCASEVGYAILMGLIMGQIYYQVYDRASAYVLLDARLALTWCLILQLFMAFDVIVVFPQERHIFLRERKAKLYSSSCFFVARTCANAPINICASVTLALITYLMCGLRINLGMWVALNIATALAGAALMVMCGALCKTFEQGNILSMTVLILAMMVNSTFVREVPGWLVWIDEVSVISRLIAVGLYYEFKDQLSMDTDEAIDFLTVQSNAEALDSLLIVLAICMIALVIAYLAVKFMHTGNTFAANLWL